MSDISKILLTVVALGTIIVIAVVASGSSEAAAAPVDGFTPSIPGAQLPATNAGAEAVRGGFGLAGQIATIFGNERAADREREARDGTNTKSGGYDGPYSAADAQRDIAAKATGR